MDAKLVKVLNNEQKSFKMFRLLDKSADNYLPINVRPARYTGICFMPMCTSREELADLVKKFFGSKGYYKYFSNYLYTLKFVYQPSLFALKKEIVTGVKKEVIEQASFTLPNLRNTPTHLYRNNKNAILDYTNQFRRMFPTNDNMLKMPVMKYSENIFPELLVRFGVDVNRQELFKWTAKYESSNTDTYINMNHDTLLVPINVNTTNNQLVSLYMDYNKSLPLSMRKNVNTMKFISMVRFVYRAFCKDTADLNDESMKYFVETLNSHNVIFFFHNKRFSFTINFNELKIRNINSKRFKQMFKSKLITLISNNMGVEDDKSIDNLIDEEEKLDLTENNNLSIDLNANIDKAGTTNKEKDDVKKENTLINDDIGKRDAARISDLIKKSSVSNIDSKSIEKKLKKDTSKLLNMIDKHQSDNQFKVLQDIEDSNEIKPEIDDEDKVLETDEEDVQEDEFNVLGDDIGKRKDEDEEEEEVYTDDIPEDLFDQPDKDIQISSTGELTEEEKQDILKEINKKQSPKKSEKQLRRIAQVRDMYKSIKAPDNRTVEEILKDTETLMIENVQVDNDNVIDKSVTTCKLQDFERSYIQKKMKQDIIKTFKSFGTDNKSIPLHIIDYDEKDTSDRFNSRTTITVKFEDEDQKQHTIKVDIPKPNDDGTLLINGNKKVLKKQIILLPLVKIDPSRLAINSWWNKVLMFRQGTVLNRKVVVIKKLVERYLIEDPNTFTLKYGRNNSSNKNYITTIEYDELAKNYHKFVIGRKNNRTVFFFNQNEIREEIKEKMIPYNFTVNELPIGIDYPNKKVIAFDLKETHKSVGDYILDTIHEKAPFKDMDNVIRAMKPPKRRIYSKVTIQSFDVPTIIFLGALYGIRNVMIVNKFSYTFSGKPLKGDERLYIRFKDGYLYYPEYPFGNTLLFNGLTEMVTEDYNFDDFDTPLPYIDWCYRSFQKRNMYKGWVGFKEIFLDEETLAILRDLSLPTDFLELFLYANEMLTDNSFTNETRAESYRIRGYEIIPHALYRAIGDQYLKYKQKENKARSSISVPQEVITTALVNSEILENYDSINPINELKMKSICTFKGVGVGGANVKHGFSVKRRAFGEDAVGIYAASNVDNGGVGITKQLTNNPRIINTRGYLDPASTKKDINNISTGDKLSPDELIMPCITKFDHPNRVGFSSGQWKHTLPLAGGGDPPMVGSGFEKTVVKLIGDTFSIRAKKDGKIININEETNSLIMEYKNGEKEAYNFGKEFIRNSNFYLENNLVINVKVGERVKFNDVLAYSKEFFTPTTGGDLTFTMGSICRVALYDDYFTEEDSSLVSEGLSGRLSTSVTKCKQISFSGKSNIIKHTPLGQYVKDGEAIFMFEDEVDGDRDDINKILEMMGDADQDALENIAYHAPKASTSGYISKIEVYWTGEIDEMSESCQKFVKAYIKSKKVKIKYDEEQTGIKSNKSYECEKSVARFGMINGAKLEENDILIEYYITHVNAYGNGDKLSFAPAIKSVTPQIVPEELTPYSESGPIDAVMGLLSLSNRQVNSPYFLGACGKILYDKSKEIAAKYLGKK